MESNINESSKLHLLKIDNSLDSAIKNGKWDNPGAAFYDKILNSMVESSDRPDEISGTCAELLEEAYLIAPVSSIKNSPYGRTPFSRSGCKYPHHSIRNGKLVVNIPGLKAAYARAKQSGDFRGDVKEHLMRHYKEMGIYEGSTMDTDQTITENFELIIDYLCESNKELKKAVEEDRRAEKEITRAKGEKRKDLVPIYGICKKYSHSKYENDMKTMKSKSELGSINFARVIKFITRGDNYSHALMSFDDSLENMISYEPFGLVHENILTSQSWLGTETVYLCVMFVPKDDKERMEKFVKSLDNKETYYAFTNLLKAYVGKPFKNDNRFICSTFTGYILQCSNPKNLQRDYSRLRPEDITILPRAFYVTNIKDRDDFVKNKKTIKEKVKAIWEEHREEIEEYNNQLPKLMLVNRLDKLKTLDKFIDWVMGKC